MNNIVIFGPVHSGKTTLAGYIYSYYMSDTEFYQKEEEIKKALEEKNIFYKLSNRFTYFISLDEDELVKNKKDNTIGTTKRIHMKHIPHREEEALIDITYIETPGVNTEKIWKQKYEGIFVGEIGIFVIDINELVKLSNMNENSQKYKTKIQDIFASLFLWCSSKDKSKVVIAISKTEKSYTADIRCAVDLIQSINAFRDIRIVPIGISIQTREEYNIFSNEKCSKRIQERYNTLMKELIDIIVKNREKRQNDIKFAYINDDMNDELVIKVLSGTFEIGNLVKMYPTKTSDGGITAETYFKIKSAQSVDGDLKYNKEIDAGNIVKLDFKNMKFLGKPVKLKDIIFEDTSLLLGSETNFVEGNYVLFNTKFSDTNIFYERYKAIRLLQKVNIVWFGKIITLEVVSKYQEEEYCCIGAMVVEGNVIMPVDKNSNEFFFPYKQFTLEIENRYFFAANLKLIKKINEGLKINCFFQTINKQGFLDDIKELNVFGQNCFETEDLLYIWYENTGEEMKTNLYNLMNILKKHKVNEYEHRLYSCNDYIPMYVSQ